MMTLLEISTIGVGGFIGAIIRYSISKKMNSTKRIPIGTLLVNLVGALLIGVVFGMELSRLWTLFFASGLAGALTTFSTLNKELLELWEKGMKKEGIIYLVVTYCAGLLFAAIGYLLMS